MGCLNHVFTPEELEDLDHKQLTILDDAILREIQTSPEIRDLLRKKLQATHLNRWRGQGQKKAAPRKGGSRTPPTSQGG